MARITRIAALVAALERIISMAPEAKPELDESDHNDADVFIYHGQQVGLWEAAEVAHEALRRIHVRPQLRPGDRGRIEA